MLNLRTVSLLAPLALAACSTSPVSHVAATKPAVLSTTFSRTCSTCHGDNGEGDFGPALAGTKLTKEAFNAVVRSGRGSMPAFTAATYSDADLAADYASFKN